MFFIIIITTTTTTKTTKHLSSLRLFPSRFPSCLSLFAIKTTNFQVYLTNQKFKMVAINSILAASTTILGLVAAAPSSWHVPSTGVIHRITAGSTAENNGK